MNRFRLKFLDVFSLIKTSSKHRKMFLDQKIPPRLEEMDLGDPQGDGGGDLEISPLSLAIFVLMAEQERAVGKWEKERMGESAVYSMSSMDMCVYLELICICVCIYIYVIYIHIYICGYIWINLITTPRSDIAGMMVGLGEQYAKHVRPVNDFNLTR